MIQYFRHLVLSGFFVCVLLSSGWTNVAFADEGAQRISIQADAGKGSITIGESIDFRISIRYKKDIEILGEISQPEMPGLEVKNAKEWRDREGAFEVLGKVFSVTAYQLGNYLIEPIEISYRTKGGSPQTLKTNPIYITVKSVAEGENKTDIRDVKGVVKLPYQFVKYLLPIGLPLVLLVLFLAYFFYFRKKETVIFHAVEKLSPVDQARRDLRELFDSSLIREGRIKHYYLRFSEILKIFLEKQFGIQASEATTSEIMRLIKPVEISEEPKKRLFEVLTAADFAKFAKWIPSPADIIELNKQAEDVIVELASATAKQEEGHRVVS